MRIEKSWGEERKKKEKEEEIRKERKKEKKKSRLQQVDHSCYEIKSGRTEAKFERSLLIRANCDTMKFIGSLLGISSPKKMGKEYMKVGRNALFGVRTSQHDGLYTDKVPRPLSFLVSKNGKLKHGKQVLFRFDLC